MPIGAEVNAILILLKVCNGAGWRGAPDICVHHKILCKLSVINLKYTLETCLWGQEKEAGVGLGGRRGWKKKKINEGSRLHRGFDNNGTRFKGAQPPSAGSSRLLHHHSPSITLPQWPLSAFDQQISAVKRSDFVSVFKEVLPVSRLPVQKLVPCVLGCLTQIRTQYTKQHKNYKPQNAAWIVEGRRKYFKTEALA